MKFTTKQKIFLTGSSLLITYGLGTILHPSPTNINDVLGQLNTHGSNLVTSQYLNEVLNYGLWVIFVILNAYIWQRGKKTISKETVKDINIEKEQNTKQVFDFFTTKQENSQELKK